MQAITSVALSSIGEATGDTSVIITFNPAHPIGSLAVDSDADDTIEAARDAYARLGVYLREYDAAEEYDARHLVGYLVNSRLLICLPCFWVAYRHDPGGSARRHGGRETRDAATPVYAIDGDLTCALCGMVRP